MKAYKAHTTDLLAYVDIKYIMPTFPKVKFSFENLIKRFKNQIKVVQVPAI